MIQNFSIPNYRFFFHREMLSFFSELKSLDTFDPGKTSTVMFNNREILMDNKPSFIREWLARGIIFFKDLLDENG